MPLQNRVDPSGAIAVTAERGMFTGNRGIIHDPATRTLLKRRWTSKAWIICCCEFEGRRRRVMAEKGWTELFFLDEVTALAAGHRPCHYCRRPAARAFARCFAAAAGEESMLAPEIDARLHAQRLASGGVAESLSASRLARLPDGAMVRAGDEFFAVCDGSAARWSFSGYGDWFPLSDLDAEPALRLTPAATCAALAAGYAPVWHVSAGLDDAPSLAH